MKNKNKIRVILISSVLPVLSGAGQSLLYRHLIDNPGIDLQVIKTEPNKWAVSGVLRRILGRLGQTKLSAFSQDAMVLWQGGWIDHELPAPESSEMPTVVMTVAHHEACYAAMRYAKQYSLPLVTFFHDWWPDIPPVHMRFKLLLERLFKQLYDQSSLALCVSPRMRELLGNHENAKVLLPIPEKESHGKNVASVHADTTFRVLYAGNLREYGPMLMEALKILRGHPNICLELRGNSASWPQSIRQEMSERGVLLPFAPISELQDWIETADAFLITQSFEDKDRRLMETNFPSKLTECAKFEKPLILWGPEYASGPKWGRETGLGLVVDQENPEQLLQALEQLFANKEQYAKLSHAAGEAATSCFSPKLIQAEFMGYLHDLIQGEYDDLQAAVDADQEPANVSTKNLIPFGFVTGCHAGDRHMVGATLASIKHFCPDVPICLIADGDVDVSDLEREYDLIVMRINDLASEEMRKMIGASYRVKLAAMWEGPFDRYVWLDSDAILWGDIRNQLREDLDFQIFWNEISVPADAEEEPEWLAHFYFNLQELKKLDPDFEWRGYPYFSAGAFYCRRNVISYKQWVEVEKWGGKNPGLFQFQDQGILNYLVFSMSQRGEIKMDWTDLQWSRNFGFDELAEDGAPFGWAFPEEVEHPAVLHFCGRKPSTVDLRCFSRPFTIARLDHYRREHNLLAAWLLILSEDMKMTTEKGWGRIKRVLGLSS